MEGTFQEGEIAITYNAVGYCYFYIESALLAKGKMVVV